MAETVYEGMFLLESGRFGRDPEKVSGQIPEMIKAAGGELLVSRLWEERRLAYPINGMRKGAYWLTYFRVNGSELPKMERKCQLSDSIMRVLFLKVDPRIVEPLVEHAMAGVHGKAAEEKPAVEKAAAAADKAAAEKAAAEKPAEEKPAEEKPAVEEAVAESDTASVSKTDE